MTVTSYIATAAAAAAAFVGTAANSAPVVFFGENQNPAFVVSGAPLTARNSFVAALSGVGTENFSSFSAGDAAPLNISFPGSAGNIGAVIDGNGVITAAPAGGTPAGRWNTTGALAAPTPGNVWVAEGAFEITFDTPISAFGFYGTDIGDFNGQVTVTLTDTNNNTTRLIVDNTVNGADASLLFWGFIDTNVQYKSLVFGNTSQGSDFFGFDDMIIGDRGQVGNPTPTPGVLALLAIGLLGLGAAQRGRR